MTAAETLKAHTRVFLVSQDSLRAMRAYVSVGMPIPNNYNKEEINSLLSERILWNPGRETPLYYLNCGNQFVSV